MPESLFFSIVAWILGIGLGIAGISIMGDKIEKKMREKEWAEIQATILMGSQLSEELRVMDNKKLCEMLKKTIWARYPIGSPESELIAETVNRLENQRKS